MAAELAPAHILPQQMALPHQHALVALLIGGDVIGFIGNEPGQAAQAVAAARAQSGLSQIQLAALTGIDQSDLSKIERGVSNPSVLTLERIAKALGGNLQISIKLPSAS